jgi:hypothetical protein
MFNLENCVEVKGKFYCWNKETEMFAVVSVKDIEVRECPPEAVHAIVKKMAKEKNDAGFRQE